MGKTAFVEPERSPIYPAYRFRAVVDTDDRKTAKIQTNTDGVEYITQRFETAEDEADAEALKEGQQWFNNPLLKAEKPGATDEELAADYEAEVSALKDQISGLKQSNLILTKQVQGLTAELDSVKGELTATEADLEAANKDLAALKADPKIAKILAKAE